MKRQVEFFALKLATGFLIFPLACYYGLFLIGITPAIGAFDLWSFALMFFCVSFFSVVATKEFIIKLQTFKECQTSTQDRTSNQKETPN